MKCIYNADIIAKWLLAYNQTFVDLEDAEYISNLKLQKLLYYAFGTYYAITGKPLFDDPIVAWTHGPVVESIYQKYKEYGSRGIDKEIEFDFNSVDQDTTSILIKVYDYFGQYSAWGLRNMTHEETPWKSTKRNHRIDPLLIKDYFLKEYIEADEIQS